jgi:hypothetical protein
MAHDHRVLRSCAAMLCSFLGVLLLNSGAGADNIRNGCTLKQLQSAVGASCGDLEKSDLIKGYINRHTLRCTGERIECCIRSATDYSWGQCETATVAPRANHDIQSSPATPAVVCADLKSERGEWKPDLHSIKASTDKKTCSQNFVCGPPDHLSTDQQKCNAVVSVSNKQVTQSGACGSDCTVCRATPPSLPCTVSFSKK